MQRHRSVNLHSVQKEQCAWSERRELKTSLRPNTEELYTAGHSVGYGLGQSLSGQKGEVPPRGQWCTYPLAAQC